MYEDLWGKVVWVWLMPEGGACVWRGLVCVSYRWGSECLSDTPQTTKKNTNSPKKLRGVGEKGKNGKERLKN